MLGKNQRRGGGGIPRPRWVRLGRRTPLTKEPVKLRSSSSRLQRKRSLLNRHGGGGGIRTPEALSSLTVFKTAAFNRSATPPLQSVRRKQRPANRANGSWTRKINLAGRLRGGRPSRSARTRRPRNAVRGRGTRRQRAGPFRPRRPRTRCGTPVLLA